MTTHIKITNLGPGDILLIPVYPAEKTQGTALRLKPGESSEPRTEYVYALRDLLIKEATE